MSDDRSMDVQEIQQLSAARRHAADGTGKAIRLAAGITMGELAQAVGVDEATIWRWERQRHRPRGKGAVRWAQVLEALRADLTAAV